MGKTIISVAVVVLFCQSVVSFDPSAECGVSAGCFSDCDNGCTFELAWTDSDTSVAFVMKASMSSLSSNGNWIAFGLANEKKMGGAIVFECATDATNFFIRRSRNNGYSNIDVVTGDSWITATTGSYSNGVITCSFTAAKSNSGVVDFGATWYLLFGKGDLDNSNDKKKHAKTPTISDAKADFSQTGALAAAGQNYMIKLHGSMMIAAWILCASIGVVVARYYKPVWMEQKLIGEKVWFTIHRSVMIFAVLFCIAGFVIIFVDRGTFQQIVTDQDFKKAHPFLGLIIMGLALIQPVMAFCRPHPGEKNRVIFNWAHWAVGIIAHILAVLNILIGTMLDAMEMPVWVVYIVVAYAAYQIVIEAFLEIYDCIDRRQSSSSKYETDSASKQNMESKYSFKKAVLVLHTIIIVGFSATLIILVAMDLSEES